jgi:hypothetical protein
MRTTVTLDPDVEALVKKRMSERGQGFKEALNGALREALTGGGRPKPYRMKTYNMGVPKVDLTHALRLAGELEDEEIVRKMQAGK